MDGCEFPGAGLQRRAWRFLSLFPTRAVCRFPFAQDTGRCRGEDDMDSSAGLCPHDEAHHPSTVALPSQSGLADTSCNELRCQQFVAASTAADALWYWKEKQPGAVEISPSSSISQNKRLDFAAQMRVTALINPLFQMPSHFGCLFFNLLYKKATLWLFK